MTDFSWRAIHKSIRGTSHVRSGLPKQDHIDAKRYHSPDHIILAVADGHGSPSSFRSRQGAKLAVRIAKSSLRQRHDVLAHAGNHSVVKRLFEDKLPGEIVYRWRKEVSRRVEAQPFTNAELENLEQHAGMERRKLVENDPYIAYGTTLLAVLITDTYIVYLQIGDGDIVTVSEDGEVARPLSKNARLIGNETTSLCSKKAASLFDVHFQVVDETQVDTRPPALILVSTDGYANSFRDEASFLKVGPDILQIMRGKDGWYTVKDQLALWLNEASSFGSGDDITLGILGRSDIDK